MDYSLPGSSVHGVLQPKILEWGAFPFSGFLHCRWILHHLSHRRSPLMPQIIFHICLHVVILWRANDHLLTLMLGFSDGSVVKNLPANAGDSGSIPGSGRSLGGGNGNPHQYSCLENSENRGAWQATVYRVAKSWTT